MSGRSEKSVHRRREPQRFLQSVLCPPIAFDFERSSPRETGNCMRLRTAVKLWRYCAAKMFRCWRQRLGKRPTQRPDRTAGTRIAREVQHELIMLPYYGVFDTLLFKWRATQSPSWIRLPVPL